jgi:epoxide hydrolase-like predicted phosphatase
MKYIGKWLIFLVSYLGLCMSASASDNELPKVIVFDFGSVVGATNQEKLAQNVAKELHLSQDAAEDLVSEYKKWEREGQEFWTAYAQTLALPENWPERFDELKLKAIEVNLQVLQIVKDIRSQGLRTALLANTTSERAAHMRELGVFAYFDPIVLSCDLGVKKPEKQAYEFLLKQAGVSANQCLFIDDKQENIDTAESLGFDCILFTSAQDLRKDLEKRSLLIL